MHIVIWSGAALSVLGIAGLGWCILQGLRAKRARLDDAALRARLRALVAWNMAALLVSLLGLMLVIVGVILAP